MEKLGVKKQDIDEYFDIMDDRVYEKKVEDEDIDKLLTKTVHQKLTQ